MAKSIANLNSSKSDKPPIALLYGVDGIGKTSLAAEWPDPIYIHTAGEEPPSDVEMATPGVIENYDELIEVIGELAAGGHEFKTAIFDSLDGIEPLIWAETCNRLGVSSIEEPGFGKGYVETDSEWKNLFDGFAALKATGMAVVLLAHPEIVRFDSPTTDPYSRYQPKLHKRAAAVVREKSDLVGFLNYRMSIKEKEVGPKKKVGHGEGGGERQIHLEECPGFLAKNRYNMPAVIPFKKGKGYSELQKFFPAPAVAS